jgi:GxxExxY protein
MTENELAKQVIDLCIKIHKVLGPGLLESAYEDCIAYELKQKNISFQRQVGVPLVYDGVELGEGFRADIIIEDKLIIELKSVAELQPVNFSQLLTYLRLTNLKLGLLINFGQRRMIDGIHRVVNGLPQEEKTSV